MNKPNKTVPNLENATIEFLLDEISRIRLETSRLKFLDGVYKQAMEARLDDDQKASPGKEGRIIKGELYEGYYAYVQQERLDTAAVREYLKDDPEGIKRCTKVTEFTQLHTKRRENS